MPEETLPSILGLDHQLQIVSNQVRVQTVITGKCLLHHLQRKRNLAQGVSLQRTGLKSLSERAAVLFGKCVCP
jgi:LPS sulfotransferase NodH